MDASLKMLLCAAVPAATMVLGGFLAALRPPSKRVASGIQHFAAGVVFAVVAVELLPDIKKEHAPLETALSFGLGVALMLGLRVVSERLEEASEKATGLPWGMLTAVGLDVLIDGLVLGAGFAAGGSAGVLLSLALGVELLSLGLATAASVGERLGGRAGHTMAAIVALAGVFAVGALGGGVLMRGVSAEWLAMLLAFGCAALLFLVTEELLVEAHEVPDSPVTTVMFFVGFLVTFLLDLVQ